MQPYAAEIEELDELQKQFREQIAKLLNELPKNSESWSKLQESQFNLFEMDQKELLQSKLRSLIEKIKRYY